MGFRDLHIFNLAILAKQGWKIIQNQDSLVARVLGAKNFPHGSFLDAHKGWKSSYTWRSLLAGRELLK